MIVYNHVTLQRVCAVNGEGGEIYMDKKQASGIAGVYYVAAELSKRGFIALVTSRNTKTTDLVAINDNTGKALNFQIKTIGIYTSDNYWLVNEKDKKELPENFIYAFVKLYKEKSPEFYLVPAHTVRKKITTETAKTGSVWHSVSRDDIKEFKDKWDSVDEITK